MKTTCFALTSLAVLTTARESALASLSDADRTALQHELEAWKASPAGVQAATNGLLPPSPAWDTASDAVPGEDLTELERFHLAKTTVAELSRDQPSATFSVATPFALMTRDEFSAMVGDSFEQSRHLREALPVARPARDLSVQAGDEVDWTTHKCTTDVRDQGRCGACYAFGAVAVAEFAHCLATGEKVDVSHQQVISCESRGKGCKGGSTVDAMNYLSWVPVCVAQDYPYTSGLTKSNGECRTDCTKKQLSIGMAYRGMDEADLQASLKLRPTAVAVEAGNSAWQFYTGGVITKCPGKKSDHSVLAVGYGTTEDGVQYYTVKNSWGADWGNNGYLKIQRNFDNGASGMCNIGESPMFHEPAL